LSRSLDLPATEGVDALAQELAKLQDNGKRRIAFLGSRHVPVVDIHLIELIARSLAEEGHNILTSGSQGVNAAVIRAVLDINPSLLTVLLPQSLDRQIPEIKEQLEKVIHLVEKSENDELPLPLASSLCNQEIILQLPRKGKLNDGDILSTNKSNFYVEIIAKTEDLIEISSNSKIELIKTAYHLGNRHVEVEIKEGILLTKSDYVIKNMLLNFKVDIKNTKKKFFPERGAHSHE